MLTGHVLGAMVQTFIAIAVVTGVAMLIGFRPSASALDWLGVVGVLVMFTFAITWLSVALAMVSKSVTTASNLPMPLMMLPFLGSGFVPTESMPTGLRWFAEHQPFTPVIETLRAFGLFGTDLGNNGWLSLVGSSRSTLIGWLYRARALRAQDRPRLVLGRRAGR